jgi:hypothetical protein
MKKIALLTVFVFTLAAIRCDSSVGVPNDGCYSSAGVLNNGAQTVHFTAEYENLIGGFFTCAGERIRRRPPNPFTTDSEECIISDLSTWLPGTYVGNRPFFVNGVGYTWLNDYDGRRANQIILIVTDKAMVRATSTLWLTTRLAS